MSVVASLSHEECKTRREFDTNRCDPFKQTDLINAYLPDMQKDRPKERVDSGCDDLLGHD